MKFCVCKDHMGPNPLPESEFGKHRGRPDGLNSWCKTCANRKKRESYAANPDAYRERSRRWAQANPEKNLEQTRRWAQANPEKAREVHRAADRRYRAANLEAVREKNREESRKQYQADPGKGREKSARWREANREQVREADHRRYREAQNAVFGHYGRECACCGSTEQLCIDHVNGGGNDHRIELFGKASESTRMYRWLIDQGFPDGFQVLCRPCNASKGDGPSCRLDHAA